MFVNTGVIAPGSAPSFASPQPLSSEVPAVQLLTWSILTPRFAVVNFQTDTDLDVCEAAVTVNVPLVTAVSMMA